MFYGKNCNYAFAFSNENDFDVYFILNEDLNKEHKDECIYKLLGDHWNSVDTCILWAAYQLFVESEWKFRWKRIIIQNADAEIEAEFKTQDELIEAMWQTFADVNIDEDEYTEQNWFIFPIKTYKYDIWYWFDEHHSKGVSYLVNEYEG